MTEKADYTGEIRSKRLGGTNVTEDMLRGMHARKGHYMGIFEVKVDETRDPVDGPHKVMLTVERVYVIMGDSSTEAHLRQLTKSMHQHQVLNSDGAQLTINSADDTEPSVEEVIAARRAHDAGLPHVFDSDNNDDGTPHCLLCGEVEDDQLHVAALVDPEVDDQVDDDDSEPDPDDPAFEPHAFTGTEGYACETCDQPEPAAIHTTADEPVPVA